MPDAHCGYGFPIGGVSAFDAALGGAVSAGGVGFDISCGVRTLTTGIRVPELLKKQHALADALYTRIPAGLGSTGTIRLDSAEMDAMLAGGAAWALKRGFGRPDDLERIEEKGRMAGADPDAVSDRAKHRQRDEMGTLGSGNHYLEVQEIAEIRDPWRRRRGCAGRSVVSIHWVARLGHQIGTEYLRDMAVSARHGIRLPD